MARNRLPRSLPQAAATIATTLLAGLALAGAARAANCTSADIAGFSASAATVGSYSTYGAAPPPAPFTVTVTTRANCTNLALALLSLSGTFAPAAPTLTFSVTGGAPTFTSPLHINVNRTTATRTWTISMAAGQIAPAGYYSTVGQTGAGGPVRTSGATVALYLTQGNRLQGAPIRTAPLDVSVTVLASCQLLPPTASNVDLSAAIVNGTANPGTMLNVYFPVATCTAPARIRLSGAALLPVGAVPPRAGFDTFINWRAKATFGTAQTMLTTSGATPVSVISPTRNQGGGAGTPGNMSVAIGLVAGNQIVAGSYAGTLTVAVDPSF